MKEFEFTLKFALPDSGQDPQIYLAALNEAGCDDAIVGIGQKGKITLQFTREACDALKAVTSATDDVKVVIPEAKLLECSQIC